MNYFCLIRFAATSDVKISLSPKEQMIFNIVRRVLSQYSPNTTAYAVGGWTRDKLLGTVSDDIDIALDDITGRQFYEYCEKYAQQNPNSGIGKSYTVEQNVEKSKHLETVAVEIAGSKIDFVNLRSESYGSSRIPTMEFGDPKTDAERRDLTINALFYNINSGQIEDYVGGLSDLRSLTLRTPLDPQKTFQDDPLRILRVLRFYSRYKGSKLSPDIIQAMSDPSIHEAYRSKVSPERAGPEILKMFAGHDPVGPLKVLYDTGMDRALLSLPEFQRLQPFDLNQENEHHEFNVKEHTFKVMEEYNKILNDQLTSGNISKKDRDLALIASWFHDKGKLDPDIRKPHDTKPGQFTYHGHEDVSADLSDKFLKQIGIGQDDREFVNTIVKHHMVPHAYTQGREQFSRRMMGKLRDKSAIPGQPRNDIWKFILWHAEADRVGHASAVDETERNEYHSMFDQMHGFMNAPPPVKPLLDGRDLMAMFPEISPKTGFIPYINGRLKEMQDAGNKELPPSPQNVIDKQSATQFVQSIADETRQKFPSNQQSQQQGTVPPTQANNNWYKRHKMADNELGTGIEGYTSQDQTAQGQTEGQKTMIYYAPGANSQFQEGKRIRDRRHGTYGRILSNNSDNTVTIKWDTTGKKEKFDLSDAPAVFDLA